MNESNGTLTINIRALNNTGAREKGSELTPYSASRINNSPRKNEKKYDNNNVLNNR